MSTLREIVDSIHVQVAKTEDDMKVGAAEYNNVRSQLNAINRKHTGIFKMARDVMENQETLNVQVTSKNFTGGLDLVKEAIDRAGYNGRIKLAIDVAATEFCISKVMLSLESCFLAMVHANHNVTWEISNFTEKKYDLDFKTPNKSGQNFKTGEDMIEMYTQLCTDYSIVFIEQPFDKDVWEHITLFSDLGICQVVGDDLLRSSPK